MYDVCIIGAGAVGAATARALSRFDLRVLLLEGGDDVASGASKANSGIVHGGYASKHGSVKARFCRSGNRMFRRLDEELGFGYSEIGSLVLAFSDQEEAILREIMTNGEKNGVDDLVLWTREQILERERSVNPEVKSGLYCPTAGIASPYEMVIALTENAITNGVDLKLNSRVTSIKREDQGFVLVHSTGEDRARFILNAAGVHGDEVSAMVGLKDLTILPRRGQYVIFDRAYGPRVNTVLFQVPTSMGKGILVTRTYHGNLMIGPNAEEIENRDDASTDSDVLNYIVETARKTLPEFDLNRVIRSFAGVRPHSDRGDFLIGPSEVPGFFQAIGIESPGFTSSPAIAEAIVSEMGRQGLVLIEKSDYDPHRRPIIGTKLNLEPKEVARRVNLPLGDCDRLVCRCEQVSEGVIADAVSRGIPVSSLDGVKRRTRAGMGRCQGAFCGPRVREVISRTTGVPSEEIAGPGEGSGFIPLRAGRFFFKEKK